MIVISTESLPPFLPTPLVTIAAMLPRLNFYSSYLATFLLSLPVTNHNLLIICFRLAKIIKSTRLCLRGPSRLLGTPDRIPQIYIVQRQLPHTSAVGPNSTPKSRHFLTYYGTVSMKSIPLCPSLIVEFIPKSHESLA
jgi:hypothetical protein